MKKSKVIIPALGILVLSTAASITGTVAWFTANNKFDTTVGEFAVVRTNDDLKCVQTAGIGTKNSEVTDHENEILVKDYYHLTDASFDHTDSNIYVPDGQEETRVAKKVALDDATDDNTAATTMVRETYTGDETPTPQTHKVLTCFTWKMEFTVKYGGVAKNYGLFMNHTANHSKVEKKNPSTGNYEAVSVATDTARGFRLAFVGQEANAESVVWADNQSYANSKYIHEANAPVADPASPGDLLSAKAVQYVAESGSNLADLADSAYAPENMPADNSLTEAEAKKRPDYLGKFAYTANTEVTLTFDVVAWFEGSDPTIVNSATVFDTVKATMYFEAIPLSAE